MPVTINGSGQVIVQIVNANLTTAATTSSTSPTSTGLTANITPTSASNKIIVLVTGVGSHSETNGNQGLFRMVRNSTNVDNQATSPYVGGVTAAITDGSRTRWPVTFCLYDSPATTSTLTYTLQFWTTGGTATLGRWGINSDFIQSTNLTLMEISGT